jgi:hypothetical protein
MVRVPGGASAGILLGAPGAALSVFVGTLCVAPSAHAAPPGQPFRLEYWAHGNCPDAIEFARQIRARAPRLRPAIADEPALGFYAELDGRADGATGSLVTRSPDGREVKREVRGPSCDDVVTALALIIALAADPTQPGDAQSDTAEAAAPRRKAPRARNFEDGSDDFAPLSAPVVESDPNARWTFGVGGGLEFDSTIAPGPGYGLSVSFEAESPGGSPLRGLLGLSAIRSAAADNNNSGGTASFTWLAFRGSACPVRWPEETPLFLRACAFVDAGELSGSVVLDDAHRDATHAWFGVGALARIEALVGVASFQLEGGGVAPLVHDEFRAQAGAPLAFETPSAGILGRIALSYRFQ